ncbi:hypothetical protein XA68_11401 [Ophiocordyceps unilateralis]|uniref:Uncharacterized protein n=1 Tax=Ophiocordyceps unilateralis TaxID=268505 RepID=A0A2A9PFM0_OPHUN|nr:hypothetical protein XA68_11401 [Ophiocordyceps unilateralis]
MAVSSVPASRESPEYLEAGLLSTGDEDKIRSLAPPPRSMSPLRRLMLAVVLGIFLGFGLSLAKDYVTKPCLSEAANVDRVVVVQQRLDSTDLLRRVLHSWFPANLANNLGRSAAGPPVFAGLARRQDDGAGGSNATSRATSSFQPQTSTDASSSSASSSADTSSAPVTSSLPSVDTSSATATSSLVGSSSSQALPETSSATSAEPTSLVTAPAITTVSSTPRRQPTSSFATSSATPEESSSSAAGTSLTNDSTLVATSSSSSAPASLPPSFTSSSSLSTSSVEDSFSSLTTTSPTTTASRSRFLWQSPSMTMSPGTPTKEESSSPTPTEANRRTVTTGRVSTSSAVRTTWTTTLSDGGVTTLTSTSWVAVVPSETAAPSSRSREADLQNAAPQMQVEATLFAMVAAFAGAIILI